MKNLHTFLSVLFVAFGLLAMPVQAESPKASPQQGKPAATQQVVTATVNINQADAATLAQQLNGIGLKKAEAIVSYREQHGPFKSADDLLNVTGIGPATVEKNRSLITVN
jgi:competence protein ComEA